jgi:putative tricarboxylic transport membrane protein
LILGLVLGPLAEINFVRAMSLSQGNFSTFITRPISLTLLIIGVLGLFAPYLKQALTGMMKRRR